LIKRPVKTADVVICGAGIAGISTAYHLSVRHGIKNVVLVDERPPFSLTSDKSTECYRNWWPGPGKAMVALMNRSIDIMEEMADKSGNLFHMNRKGYLFVTADGGRISDFKAAAEESCELGAGPLRIHSGQADGPDYIPSPTQGFEGVPDGADLILDSSLMRKHFPFLSENTLAALHVRRAGWMSAQQMAMYMLEKAREKGTRFLKARIDGVGVKGGRIQNVQLSGENGSFVITTDKFVNAAGPFVNSIGEMMGVRLPVFCELHAKISFTDSRGAIPRSAPLYFWADPQELPWSEEEKKLFSESEKTRWLLDPFPSGPHGHPEGGLKSRVQLTLWTYDIQKLEPVFPLPTIDPYYHEVVLRGLSRMIPGLRGYFDNPPKPVVDGGYYAKTRENRPLLGPLPVDGGYIIGALSGFGIMAGCAAGELLAAHLTGSELPDYARWFLLERYEDSEYKKLLDRWDDSGQL